MNAGRTAETTIGALGTATVEVAEEQVGGLEIGRRWFAEDPPPLELQLFFAR